MPDFVSMRPAWQCCPMRRARTKAALVLTLAEKGHLESLAKATAAEDRTSKRAKIVLL